MAPGSLSARAEGATRLLFQTLGMHQKAMASPTGGRRYSRRLGVVGLDPQQVQRQATLLRLVSITEAFCAEQLIMHTERAVDPTADPIRTLIWEQVAIDTTRTWEAQKDAFKKWHQISANWLELEGLAEVRNAVAHGLGTLTRRQQRSHSSTMTKINRTGISVVNDKVVLEEQDLISAAKACRALISQIDAEVTAKTP